MSTLYTTLEKINIAKVSEYLALNAIAKGGLSGGGQDINLPRKLYAIRKNVEWLYDLDSSDETLIPTGNYLLALCAPYNMQAANIISAGGGGTVSPINPSVRETPLPIEFVVDNSGTFMISGESTVNIPQFIGYNVMFNRNYVPQTQVYDVANSYFSWDRDTGDFTCYPAVSYQEILSINAV